MSTLINPHEPVMINPEWLAWEQANNPDVEPDEIPVITLERDNTEYGIIENILYDAECFGLDIEKAFPYFSKKYNITRR